MSLNRTAMGRRWEGMLGYGDETLNDKEIKWRNYLKMSCGGGVQHKTWVQTKQATTVLTQKDAGIFFYSPQRDFKFVIVYVRSLVQSFLLFYFRLFGDHVYKQRMNKPFILYSSTENKGELTSCLCMKMFYNRGILYCGLFRGDWWLRFKQCQVQTSRH